MNKHKAIGISIIGLQVLSSVLLIIITLQFGAVPFRFCIMISVILLALLGIMYVVLVKTSKKRNLLKGVSVFLSVVFLVISFYQYRGYSAVDAVTGTKHEIETMNVIVLASNAANTISDVGKDMFGVVYGVKRSNTETTIKDIEDHLKSQVKTKEYKDYFSLVDDLLSGKVNVVIISDAFMPIIEDTYEGFSSKIKILDTYSVTTDVVMPSPTATHAAEDSQATDSPKQEQDITKHSFNIFLAGIDVEGSVNKVSRCDVDMIVTVNPVTKEILLTSTPRDYYVYTTVSGDMRDKLTHAGIYGVECSIGTLERLYGISIDYFAKVNFTGFVDIVDALGGVNVYSEREFTSHHGGDHFVVGYNECDGEKALGFVRERYSFESGDLQRNRNQQYLVKGIVEKMSSPAMLLGINKLLDKVSNFMATNMEVEEVMKLVNMQLSDAAKWTIVTNGVSGTGASEITYSSQSHKAYVMYPDEEQVKRATELITEVYNRK